MVKPRGTEEHFHLKESFKKMTFKEKIEYIFAYYKLPVITAIIAAAVLISTAVERANRKEPVLYTAFANVGIGETLLGHLSDEYLTFAGKTSKQTVSVYLDLYISDDASSENHQYAYASKLKVLGALSSRQLDVVFMNKEAYDLFSSSGFLCRLDDLLKQDTELYNELSDLIVSNTVILDDNAIEYDLGEAEEYKAETTEIPNGLDVSTAPCLASAGFPDTVYFGVIENSTHKEEALSFAGYLFEPYP
jgi:hypothetical protein